MLEPPYFKRKNYKLTVKLNGGQGRYFWTRPEHYDYEDILKVLKVVVRAKMKYRLSFMGLVWAN